MAGVDADSRAVDVRERETDSLGLAALQTCVLEFNKKTCVSHRLQVAVLYNIG